MLVFGLTGIHPPRSNPGRSRTPWFDAWNDTPWGFIVGADGNKKDPWDKPCAEFPTTLGAFQPGATATVDVVALIDGLVAENRTQRLAEEDLNQRRNAWIDRAIASIKTKDTEQPKEKR